MENSPNYLEYHSTNYLENSLNYLEYHPTNYLENSLNYLEYYSTNYLENTLNYLKKCLQYNEFHLFTEKRLLNYVPESLISWVEYMKSTKFENGLFCSWTTTDEEHSKKFAEFKNILKRIFPVREITDWPS